MPYFTQYDNIFKSDIRDDTSLLFQNESKELWDNIIKNNKRIYTIKNKLLLICLGPTATVMCYDLAKIGLWAIDIGHYFEIYSNYFLFKK